MCFMKKSWGVKSRGTVPLMHKNQFSNSILINSIISTVKSKKTRCLYSICYCFCFLPAILNKCLLITDLFPTMKTILFWARIWSYRKNMQNNANLRISGSCIFKLLPGVMSFYCIRFFSWHIRFIQFSFKMCARFLPRKNCKQSKTLQLSIHVMNIFFDILITSYLCHLRSEKVHHFFAILSRAVEKIGIFYKDCPIAGLKVLRLF